MNFIQFFQFPLFPLSSVDCWVQEVDPFLAALDLGAFKTPLLELFSYSFPSFGGELWVQG
jgi:hypothetical protein